MYTDSQNKEVMDSVKIVNNQFIFKGKIDSPTEAAILDKSSARINKEGKIVGMWKGSGSQVQFEINKLLAEFVNGNKN